MQKEFWLLSLSDLIKSLDSNITTGLTDDRVKNQKKRYGSNVISTQKRISVLFQFLSHFKSPFVILLFVAAGLSAFVQDLHSAIIILVMIFMSVCLDFFQEYRAQRAAQKLRQSMADTSRVIRRGEIKEILSASLVPGDIVLLTAGDLIPADGRLFFAKDLFVNQAALTGESFPASKTAEDLKNPTSDLTEATNAVFMGTSVLGGEGKMIVCNTGRQSFLGDIATVLSHPEPSSAFESGIKQFGFFIIRLTVLMFFFVLVVNLVLHKPLLDTVLFALALTVGITPELLPMVISVSLSRGSLRMAQKQVIVKRLSAIHDLGSMNVLCTDKTGTLTEADIQLKEHVDCDGNDSDHVLTLAYLNSYFETGIKSHLDTAILGHKNIDVNGWTKIDEIPFDFERRKLSVLLNKGEQNFLIVKGSSEEVLAVCSRFEANNGKDIKKLDQTARTKINALFTKLSQEGLRLLSIAWKPENKTHTQAVASDEKGFIFAGFVTFFDPPNKSAKKALELLSQHHINLKIITGDNEYVTQHLCSELDIPILGLLRGSDINTMSDKTLQTNVEKTNLFCQVNPAQKTRIIEALKSLGYIVGFMGDGINDAASLHTAHVGISIDTAVDVAREAADLILLQHDLRVVNNGVIEGRRTCANIMKYIMMVTSSNFGSIISMAVASFVLPFLPMRAPQILLNNFLYDISEIPIPWDNVDKDTLTKPYAWSLKFVNKFMLILGPVSSIFDFVLFYIMLKVMKMNEALFQTSWFIESTVGEILVIFIIRTRLSPFKSFPHPFLTASSLLLVAIAMIIPFSPLGVYFRFTPPPLVFFGILIVIIMAYLTLAEYAKRYFYNKIAPLD